MNPAIKRALLAAALLIGAAAVGRADYVLLISNLGPKTAPAEDSGEEEVRRPPPEPGRVRALAVAEVFRRADVYDHKGSPYVLVAHQIGNQQGESPIWAAEIEVETFTRKDGSGKQVSLLSAHDRFRRDFDGLTRLSAPTVRQLIDLAEWALTHGLLPDFEKAMDEAVKLDPAHPACAAYEKVKKAVAAGVPSMADSHHWRETLLPRFKPSYNEFYVLLHRSREDSQEVVPRLKMLKESFVAFHYWHALRGRVLPMPEQKLVAVVAPADQSEHSFYALHRLFGSPPVTADGFYSVRHNLLILASRRLDDPYDGLVKHTQEFWGVFDRDEILKPRARKPKDTTYEMMYVAQTYSLMLRAMEEDGARTAATRGAAYQTLLSAGVLPRSADVPLWLESGIGSFMQTPLVSPWKTYSAPHWRYQLTFLELRSDEETRQDPRLGSPERLLHAVLADDFFREGQLRTPPVKARATAWALYYYLAQKKLDGLEAYYRELSRMPRDLKTGAAERVACFARAFGLDNPDPKVRARNLKDFAETWVRFIENDVKLDNEAEPMLRLAYMLDSELMHEHRAGR